MNYQQPKGYQQLNAGDGLVIDKLQDTIYFGCCDCHLVHKFVFKKKKNEMIMYVYRDNRRTGQRRRYAKKVDK